MNSDEILTATEGQSRAPVERLAYSVEEAAEALGISRNAMYTLIHREDFPAIKIGKRRVISTVLLAEWVETQARNRAVIE